MEATQAAVDHPTPGMPNWLFAIYIIFGIVGLAINLRAFVINVLLP